MPGVKVNLVVPTLNPGRHLLQLTEGIKKNRESIHRVLIMDSASTDGSQAIFERNGFECYCIPRVSFDHGGTRMLAIEHLDDERLVVFLTQDAYLEEGAIARLIEPFLDNPSCAVAYGRQLPHSDASPFACFSRYFNYGSNSIIKDFSSIQELGLKTAFCSNSFACYDPKSLSEVGGFPTSTIFGEDMIAAAKLVLARYLVCYQADATVRHSHEYSIREEIRRSFDIGVMHTDTAFLLKRLGTAEGTGMLYAKGEILFCLGENRYGLAMVSVLRSVFKYLGYRLGRSHRLWPSKLNRTLSMNSGYW
jgi:rhamnosyltransferase